TPVFVDWTRWDDVIEQQDIQVVILGNSQCYRGDQIIEKAFSKLNHRRLDLTLLADISYPAGIHREFDHFTGSSYLTPSSTWQRTLQLFCKRSIDLLFGLTGSILTIVLTPLIKILINLEDPGPVFHLREYVGPDGKTRYYRKFRTMVCNADEIL